MKHLLGLLFLFCVTLIVAQTPITLNNSNMPSSGDTLRFTSVNLNSIGNYTQTGTNFTWNFSSVTTTTEGLRSYKSALQTPYALFFLSFSGFAEKLPDITIGGTVGFTDYYNFYKKQNSPTQAYIADGVGMTFSGAPLPSYYTDKDELYLFPMTYPKYDSTTFRFTTPASTIIPIVYSRTGYRVTNVDGWGTVQTPYGTEACLRLVTTQYGTDSIKNNIIPIPLGIPSVVRSYQWLTLNSKIPYFEVSGNVVADNFVPTSARFRGYRKELPNPVGLSEASEPTIMVYPNPVKDVLTISGSGVGITPVVYNLQGQVVLKVAPQFQGQEQVIDMSSLAPGIYSISLQTSEKHLQLRFVKQ